MFFNHKVIHVDFHSCTALVEDRIWLSQSIEVKLAIMLRADGAHSAVRYHMMKTSRMDYQHECLDVLWCELRMEPGKVRGDTAHAWKISPSHRHMWPAEDSMFIATPNEVTTSGCLLHN
ncbi:hypothetical protein ACQRIT_000041 [Beauveria bassiana]